MGDSFEPDTARAPDSFEADSFEADKTPAAVHEPIKDRLKRYAHNVSKGVDYDSGTVRTALGSALGPVIGKELVKPGEFSAGAHFDKNYPTSAEMLQRAGWDKTSQLSDTPLGKEIYDDPANTGVDKWYAPNKGGMLDPTARGAVGFGLDTALAPSTWLMGPAGSALKIAILKRLEASGGAALLKNATPEIIQTILKKAAGAPAAIMEAPSRIAKKSFNTAYEFGMGPQIEKAAARKGKDAAEAYYRQGISSTKNMGEAVAARREALQAETKAIYDEALAKGAKVNPTPDFLTAEKSVREKIGKGVSPDEHSAWLEDMLERHPITGADIPINQGAALKSDLRVGKRFDNMPGVLNRDHLAAADKAMATSLQHKIENEVESKIGRGAELGQKNSDLGIMIDTQGAALDRGMSKAGHSPLALDPMDYLIMSGEVAMPAHSFGSLWGLQKGLRVATHPRSLMPLGYYGKKMMDVPGVKQLMDIPTRRAVVERMREQQPPEEQK